MRTVHCTLHDDNPSSGVRPRVTVEQVDAVASSWFDDMHRLSIDAQCAAYLNNNEAAFAAKIKCEQIRDCANELLRLVYGTHVIQGRNVNNG